jgi:hypothetical protein
MDETYGSAEHHEFYNATIRAKIKYFERQQQQHQHNDYNEQMCAHVQAYLCAKVTT